MSARASSVMCGSSVLLCMTVWLLTQIMLREPGAIVGAYLASQTINALLISQLISVVMLAAIARPTGSFGERLSILLCPVLLPLPLMLLATMASDVSLPRAALYLVLPVFLALVLSYVTELVSVRSMARAIGDAGFATLQLIAVAVIMAIAPAMVQWLQL